MFTEVVIESRLQARQKLIDQGVSPAEADRKATATLGDISTCIDNVNIVIDVSVVSGGTGGKLTSKALRDRECDKDRRFNSVLSDGRAIGRPFVLSAMGAMGPATKKWFTEEQKSWTPAAKVRFNRGLARVLAMYAGNAAKRALCDGKRSRYDGAIYDGDDQYGPT